MVRIRHIVPVHEGFKERLDTSSAAGELVFHVFGAIAHFERRLISERTREGLTAALNPSSNRFYTSNATIGFPRSALFGSVVPDR